MSVSRLNSCLYTLVPSADILRKDNMLDVTRKRIVASGNEIDNFFEAFSLTMYSLNGIG